MSVRIEEVARSDNFGLVQFLDPDDDGIYKPRAAQVAARWIAFGALAGQTLGLLVVPFLVPAPSWFVFVLVAQALVDVLCVRLAYLPRPHLSCGATAAARAVGPKADDGDLSLTTTSLTSTTSSSPPSSPASPSTSLWSRSGGALGTTTGGATNCRENVRP